MTLDGEERELFERSLRRATETTSGERLDAALGELGWHDALAADRRTSVSLLFELQGRAASTSSALDVVLASALGLEATTGAAVVLPSLGAVTPPGAGADGAVRGLATSGIQRAELAVVAAAGGVGTVATKELDLRPVDGIDPRFGLVEVTAGRVDAVALEGAAWADAVAAGQLALAHELIGASRAMLELARTHALERIQFDRPIAQFQAVRHRLAETVVAIEGAADATEAAWDEGTPLAASVAKAIAGRSARVAAKHCQQVLAGIGFTSEHGFHLHLRRALVLDRLLGDAKSLTRAMGEEILRTRRIPPILPL